MINFFVETKSEYTTQLVNVLTPLIFEGLRSIYSEALKLSNDSNNVLSVFQSFLKRIPKWNPEMIKQETDRIMNNSKSYSWLPDLVKATVKANIIILTYNPSSRNPPKIDPKYYKDIKIEEFIHKIYIECARELWNNPYLMYHQYTPIELKRNQRDTIFAIKDSIREAIRKLLPVKQILEIYLGEELEPNMNNDQFERNISEADANNIQKLINKELNQKVEPLSNNNQAVPTSNQIVPTNNQLVPTSNQLVPTNNQAGGNNIIEQNKPGDLNSKILEIINQKTESEPNSYGTPKDNINNIDNKIKNILEKDLGEPDLETSLSYHQEANDKDYQEIFANNAESANKNMSNTKDKDSSKSKRKFFNNYLNF